MRVWTKMTAVAVKAKTDSKVNWDGGILYVKKGGYLVSFGGLGLAWYSAGEFESQFNSEVLDKHTSAEEAKLNRALETGSY